MTLILLYIWQIQWKLQARTNIGAGTSNFSGSYNDLTDKPEISEPIAEAIRDNTTQINSTTDGTLSIGNSTFKSGQTNLIAIGKETHVNAWGGVAVGYNTYSGSTMGTAIGYKAEVTSNASEAIAIGGGNPNFGSNAIASAERAFQIGSGINKTANTLQIRNATFQNLQIDGVDEYPTLSGADAPTTTTVGKVKQFYVETTTPALYYCSSITGTGTTEDPYVYNWTQAGGDETLAKQIQNNEVQIAGAPGSGLKLGGATHSEIQSVAIGYLSNARFSGSVCVGQGTESTSAAGIAIGLNAKADVNINIPCIQLGTGRNTHSNTLQIKDDNIYNFSTHTLTVQNAQVNGNNVYGVLQGETDPTGTTVGAVGQFYLNTASKALWQCVAITTTDATTYTWQQVGGSTEKKYLHTFAGRISAGPNYGSLNFSYVDSDATPLTEGESYISTKLANKLIELGYTGTTWYTATTLPASGYYAYAETDQGIIYGIYAITNTKGVYAVYAPQNTTTQSIRINNEDTNVITKLNYSKELMNSTSLSLWTPYIKEVVTEL